MLGNSGAKSCDVRREPPLRRSYTELRALIDERLDALPLPLDLPDLAFGTAESGRQRPPCSTLSWKRCTIRAPPTFVKFSCAKAARSSMITGFG